MTPSQILGRATGYASRSGYCSRVKKGSERSVVKTRFNR